MVKEKKQKMSDKQSVADGEQSVADEELARESKPTKTSLYMLQIMAVLREHASVDNPLDYTEIAEKVRKEYGGRMTRDTASEHIEDLLTYLDDEIGSNLGFTIEIAKKKEGSNKGRDGYYLKKHIGLTDTEMRFLVDGLVFSKCISYGECKYLVEKLGKVTSKNSRQEVKYAKPLPGVQGYDRALLGKYRTITKAINDNKQINFVFAIDEPSEEELKKLKVFTVSPYELVLYNNRYYMICAFDKGHSYHYRLDFMHDVTIPEKITVKGEDGKLRKRSNLSRRPLHMVDDLKNGYVKDGIDLIKYMSEHLYMFGSNEDNPVISVTFLIDKDRLYHVFDWFGTQEPYARPDDEDPSKYKVTVKTVRKAMLYWLLQYGQTVEVLTPKDLRKEVRSAAEEIVAKYSKEPPK